ncbi:hypothetical protein Tdes44962_MAKER06188 [Teratosphaeria destructans]|uniref:F-box domain-containing protein n=1 Tax=Teratosphaeria destructans TaxID=418781 RepID=A0A9W7SIL2_9PEZI|nr:hypothetical protein Tdes44962_MAKER06188 [Teratosphaeria destructans]
MAAAKPLATIPEELQTKIADFTKPLDLIALRQTCRTLARTSHDAFAKSFFRTREHDLSMHGLKTLLDIVTISVFGRRIQEIVLIGVAELPFDHHDNHTEQVLEKDPARALDTCGALLMQLFHSLVAAGYVPALKLSAATSGFDDVNNIVGRVLYALVAAKYPIEDLTLSWPYLSHGAFAFFRELPRESTQVFHSLRRLAICDNLLDSIIADFTGSGMTVLRKATLLEELKLFDEDHVTQCSSCLDEVFGSLRTNSLKSVEVSDLCVDEDDDSRPLLTCLRRCGVLLERIVIRDVMVRDDETWQEIAAWMFEKLHALKYLRLERLTYLAEDGDFLAWYGSSTEGEYQGREAVKKALSKMCEQSYLVGASEHAADSEEDAEVNGEDGLDAGAAA